MGRSSSKLGKKQLIKTFAIKAIIFYLLWQGLYILIVEPDGNIDAFLSQIVIELSEKGLNLIGLDTHISHNIIFIDNQAAVRVEKQCNSLELLALYIGFIVCFPGRIKFKLLYVIFGSILVFLANVLRVMLLAVNYNYYNVTFDVNHKYTYVILVYILVFFIWKHWVKRYSVVGKYDTR